MVGHHLRCKRNDTCLGADTNIILLWFYTLSDYFLCANYLVTQRQPHHQPLWSGSGFWQSRWNRTALCDPVVAQADAYSWKNLNNRQEYQQTCFQSYLHAQVDQRRPFITTWLLARLGATYLVQQLVKTVLSISAGLSEVDFAGFERQDPARTTKNCCRWSASFNTWTQSVGLISSHWFAPDSHVCMLYDSLWMREKMSILKYVCESTEHSAKWTRTILCLCVRATCVLATSLYVSM